MIVKAEEIEKVLVEKYSLLTDENVWPTDELYLLPKLEDVLNSIKRNSVKDLPYIKNIGECEEFALYLHAAVKKERHLKWESLPEAERYNWAFGEAIGFRSTLFGTVNHTMNIAVLEDFAVVIIEPREDLIEEVDIEKFSAFFVKM